MSGDQSRSTVEIANFTIDTKTETVPIHNGDRCSVKETNLNCDAVLTLLDKKKSENDETLFSLSINNYDNRINDEMKNSLEKYYYNVIYYNSQLKKFYSSYNDEKDKGTVKEKISHILILGKKDISPKSDGSYILNIDKTILIYEASHANITSANQSNPALTMYEYFNLIYIDWFSLLLSDFEKEFEKFKSVMPQEVLSARAASTEADSRADSESEAEAEAESEADFQLVGEQRVVEGVGGEEEGEGEGEGEEEGDTQRQRATNAASKIQTAIRVMKAAKQAKKEEARKEEEIEINRGNFVYASGGSSFGKKKGKKTKKLN